MADLKPCPKCKQIPLATEKGGEIVVACPEMCVSPVFAVTPDEAIAAWNRRAK